MDNEVQITPIDYLGQEVNPGDFVVGATGHGLAIYKVLRITPKMVRIVSITAKTDRAKKGKLRYANELLKVEEKIVTFHLMKS